MVKKQPVQADVPQRIPEGFLLTVSQQEQKMSLYLLIFGLVWTATSLTFLLMTMRAPMSWVVVFTLLFVGVFVIIGIAILGFGLLEIWTNLQLYPAELIMPKYPLRMGESCPIRYRRRFRHGALSSPGQIEAQISCDEWIEYRQGTDLVTKTQTLWEKSLPSQTVLSGESQADYSSEIQIPIAQPPSFDAAHNKIRWQLIVKLQVPGIPQVCRSIFHLKIMPEVLP